MELKSEYFEDYAMAQKIIIFLKERLILQKKYLWNQKRCFLHILSFF